VAFSLAFFRFNFQLMDILSSHNNPFIVADRLAGNWSHFCMKSPHGKNNRHEAAAAPLTCGGVENVDGVFNENSMKASGCDGAVFQ
jgi:hypothetical protein